MVRRTTMLRKKGVFGDGPKNDAETLKQDFIQYRDYLSSNILPSYLKDYGKNKIYYKGDLL